MLFEDKQNRQQDQSVCCTTKGGEYLLLFALTGTEGSSLLMHRQTAGHS